MVKDNLVEEDQRREAHIEELIARYERMSLPLEFWMKGYFRAYNWRHWILDGLAVLLTLWLAYIVFGGSR